ncbi:MAG: DUF805 domain-containing protein [Stellaceae bacterium]
MIFTIDYELKDGGALFHIYLLCSILPNCAITVRRCHDRDRSGWFVLIWLIPIVHLWVLLELGFLPGTTGDNQFGPEPVGASFRSMALARKGDQQRST